MMIERRFYERPPIDSPEFNSLFVEDIERYIFSANMVAGCRVLDIACGTGYGSYLLGTKGGALWTLGIDRSEEAIRIARRFTVPGRVEFVVGVAERIPVKSGIFDVVVSLETIEHLEDPEPFLLEVRRVLRSGGKAVISTPLNNSEGRLVPENPYHRREYSSEEFLQLAQLISKHVELYSQVTTYQDDLWPEFLETNSLISRFRNCVRSLTPPSFRRLVRDILGSQGRRPVSSRIERGIKEGASVQIAVCQL
jgi:ubiquinone/menaquinone biosynthesis C-methylase UbiE